MDDDVFQEFSRSLDEQVEGLTEEDKRAAFRLAVVLAMAGKHGIDMSRAERIVLGYEPEPGTLWHARVELAERWKALMRAIRDALLGDA